MKFLSTWFCSYALAISSALDSPAVNEGSCLSCTAVGDVHQTSRAALDSALLQTTVVRKSAQGGTLWTADSIMQDFGVTYASDHYVQKADLQWPNTSAPNAGWPAIIACHGNGGAKETMRWFCRKMAMMGRLCMAMGRRDDEGMAIKKADTKSALEWLLENRNKYHVDSDHLIMYGYSMGGFITNNLIWLDAGFADLISGMIIASGVEGDHLRKAHENGPPALIISCTNDLIVPYWKSKALYDMLVSWGTEATLFTCDTGHTSQAAEGFYDEIEAFLDRVAPVPTPTPAPTPEQECQSWCSAHATDWTAKCSWWACGACAGCMTLATSTTSTTSTTTSLTGQPTAPPTPTSQCESWCSPYKSDWTLKCLWTSCGGCAPCQSLASGGTTAPPSPSAFQCESWCPTHTSDWASKCSWPACGLCAECVTTTVAVPASTPTAPTPSVLECQSWCASGAESWSSKCTWSTCGACTDCSGETQRPTARPTSPPTPSTLECQSWCDQGSEQWSSKCTWWTCGACAECARSQCEDWCVTATADWPSKCDWAACGACSGCTSQCEDWCVTATADWPSKCGWAACGACSGCTSQCEDWCVTATADWSSKCGWATCGACSGCTGGVNAIAAN